MVTLLAQLWHKVSIADIQNCAGPKARGIGVVCGAVVDGWRGWLRPLCGPHLCEPAPICSPDPLAPSFPLVNVRLKGGRSLGGPHLRDQHPLTAQRTPLFAPFFRGGQGHAWV